jgi:hypothetical protein
MESPAKRTKVIEDTVLNNADGELVCRRCLASLHFFGFFFSLSKRSNVHLLKLAMKLHTSNIESSQLTGCIF